MSEIPEIDIDDLERRMAGGAAVVDVREHDEYVGGHVAGSVHIALGSVPDRLAELPRAGELLVICAVGGRSARAVHYLRTQGVAAVNVAGGTRAWIESGRPIVFGSEPS